MGKYSLNQTPNLHSKPTTEPQFKLNQHSKPQPNLTLILIYNWNYSLNNTLLEIISKFSSKTLSEPESQTKTEPRTLFLPNPNLKKLPS